MRKLIIMFRIGILLLPSQSLASDPLNLYPTFWGTVASEYGLDPYLLYSIALVESRREFKDGMVRPSPWAIVENGEKTISHYPKSKSEAETLLKQLLKKTNNIDIGMMQVNLIHHGHRVKNPEDLLDIETNLMIAGRILVEAMKSAPGEGVTGVGRYHSWREERSTAYGSKVLMLVSRLREGKLSRENQTKSKPHHQTSSSQK